MESVGDAGPAARHDIPTHPLGARGVWIARWLGAMATASLLGVTLFLALEGDGWGVAWMVVFTLPIVTVVGVLTLVAAVLRWLLSRFASVNLDDALVPVVSLGIVAAAVPLLLFYFGGDLMALRIPPIGNVIGLVAPAGLSGGVASYLAERQVSWRRPRWWVATIGAAVAGALLTTVALSSG